jgi:type II secretory ATPase GspE/PulE/Tfp pilus assembly ATPase PilB-like protein
MRKHQPDITDRLPPDPAIRMRRDITASMPHSAFATVPHGSPAFAMPFQWPAPPHYEIVDDGAGQGAEKCVLTLMDGAKMTGVLLEFLSDDAVLDIKQAGAAASISIAFRDLIELQLLRPVAVRREAILVGGIDQEMFAASDRQPFTVKRADGPAFQGETVGHVHALCGLFLFLPRADGKVIRCFVPAHSAQDSRIGKPIGEMLIDEKLASAEAVEEALEKQKGLRTRKLGDYLTANQIVSQEQLAAALNQQRSEPVQKLGESLLELGFLTRVELNEALAIEARDRSIPLGQILVDMGVVDVKVIQSVMARKLGIPFVNLRDFHATAEALKRIPFSMASRFQVMPLAEAENGLVVAVENPTTVGTMEEVRFITGTKLIPVMATAPDIKDAIERAYGPVRDLEAATRSTENGIGAEQLTRRLSREKAADNLNEQQGAQIDSTLVKLVNKIILDAVEQKASDIHIEVNPGEKDVRVRFRKDGALVTYLEIPARFRTAVVSRIKIMSQLDITERRKPQDGKVTFNLYGPVDVELRIATIPTANGLEDIVMRVLAAATPKPLDQLGFDADSLESITRLISRPHGMFLVCGPTGSGKTTTLHSLLGFLNTPEAKIWTAEDPIEITQAGLRQVQMNAKIGWTFAAAMRSFMRADPDIIMVGEMRDAETAKIGVEASLTGHLVFSTLHTNSAAESVVRLLDLGMDPFNFADALLGVLAQRLVRTLCAHCRVKHEPTVRELEDLAAEYCADSGGDIAGEAEKLVKNWRTQGKVAMHRNRPKGCKECDRTGYKGRMAVYELMVADAAVKRLIQTHAPITEISAAALANGMRTLKQDGIEKVLQGHTDMSQVRGVW